MHDVNYGYDDVSFQRQFQNSYGVLMSNASFSSCRPLEASYRFSSTQKPS